MRNPYANGAAPLSMLADPFRERESDDLINRKMPDTLLGNRKADGLLNAVGPNRGNHPSDVARVERRLGGVGYLDPARASRPTGRFDGGLVRDLRAYQQANGLKVDALLNPGGPTERSLDAGIGRLRRNAAPRRVELDVERGAENQRLADAITKTGDLGPLPIYVGEAAMGREKGRDEIVDLFRRVAAHGEDVAERLHSALKGHVDPDLHRTLYAESQIPEPDGGEDGDDEEENPGTPQTPPTKPDDPKKPGDPDQPDKPDEGNKEDPKVPKPDPCLLQEIDAKTAQEDVIAIDREIDRKSMELEAAKKRLGEIEAGDAKPDEESFYENWDQCRETAKQFPPPQIPLPPFQSNSRIPGGGVQGGKRPPYVPDGGALIVGAACAANYFRNHRAADMSLKNEAKALREDIPRLESEIRSLKASKPAAEKAYADARAALERCKAEHKE